MLVVAGVWLLRTRVARPAANVVVVRRGAITATVDALGRVQPARQARLSLQTGGRVEEVLVRVGDQVEAGQLLLRLEASDARRRVQEAALNLEAQRRQLAEAKAGPSDAAIEIARAELRRATVSLQVAQAAYDEVADEEDAGTRPEAAALESAKAAYERARAEFERVIAGPTPEEIARLETQVKLAQMALEEAQAALAATELRAPFAGTIVEVEVAPGENVGGFVPLMVLADLSTLEIQAEIDEIDVAEVAPGQKVEIRLDAFPGHVLESRVARVAPAASRERGATVYLATVPLPETDLSLRAGMGASLKITTVEKMDVLLVPNRAVQTVGRKKVVKVLQGGAPREVEVVTGLSNERETEIVEGLWEGAQVLLE
jgi:RND family efflux transporter MFP subunit